MSDEKAVEFPVTWTVPPNLADSVDALANEPANGLQEPEREMLHAAARRLREQEPTAQKRTEHPASSKEHNSQTKGYTDD